jgi:hypothetical protein
MSALFDSWSLGTKPSRPIPLAAIVLALCPRTIVEHKG